jgi:hypothetical protein
MTKQIRLSADDRDVKEKDNQEHVDIFQEIVWAESHRLFARAISTFWI